MRFDSLKNAMFMLISHGIGGAIYMFGIVRFEKYGKADLYGIEKEANRSEKARSEGLELPGTFCDWDRTGQNYYFDKTDKWVRHIDERLKAENITRIRKDAVYGLGVFCGASPEFFEGKTREETLKFFADMRQEIIDVICQGDASRLINFVCHFDEKTPHAQAMVIPLHTQEKDGQRTITLSANKILNGSVALNLIQNRFHQDVFKGYGFERGQETSKQKKEDRRKHVDTSTYYEKKRKLTFQDVEQAQKLVVDANSKVLADTSKPLSEASQSLVEARRAVDRARIAITQTGKEYKVQDALDALDNATKSIQESYQAQYEATRKAQTLLSDIEKAIDERASEKLEDARVLLQLEKERILKKEEALKAKANALDEKEKSIDRYIEQQAQTKAKTMVDKFIDRVKRFLGSDGWKDFLRFQDNERKQEQTKTQSQGSGEWHFSRS